MEIVIDSHALFWYLSENPKLSSKAKRLINEAQKIIVPSIVVMEILYLLDKHRIAFRFVDFLSEMKRRNYIVYPLDLDVITQSLFVSTGMEMHDRIIVATAQLRGCSLISKDREITVLYKKTVW